MTITIKELLEVTRILLESLDKNEITLKDSLYLKIWHKDIDTVLNDQARTHTIGDANDDIERMKQLLYEERDSMYHYDLERLGAILIQIGATIHED